MFSVSRMQCVYHFLIMFGLFLDDAGEPPPVIPIQATLLRELRPCPEADSAMPIRAVWHVPGSKASEASSILILGGQGMDEPDMLYLLPLEPSDPKEVHSPSSICTTCFPGLAQVLLSNARLPSSSVCSRIHPFLHCQHHVQHPAPSKITRSSPSPWDARQECHL